MSNDTIPALIQPDRDKPFSFEGYTIVRGELITKRAPVPGNKRIPICLYCGTRHGLQKKSRHKAVLYNGIKVEYEEDLYYCDHTKWYFMTRQMDERNDRRRQEAYERLTCQMPEQNEQHRQKDYEHSAFHGAETQQDDKRNQKDDKREKE